MFAPIMCASFPFQGYIGRWNPLSSPNLDGLVHPGGRNLIDNKHNQDQWRNYRIIMQPQHRMITELCRAGANKCQMLMYRQRKLGESDHIY